MSPPSVLQPVPVKTAEKEESDEIGMMFENGLSKEGVVFADSDYEESNKSYNRVKNYSFARRER